MSARLKRIEVEAESALAGLGAFCETSVLHSTHDGHATAGFSLDLAGGTRGRVSIGGACLGLSLFSFLGDRKAGIGDAIETYIRHQYLPWGGWSITALRRDRVSLVYTTSFAMQALARWNRDGNRVLLRDAWAWLQNAQNADGAWGPCPGEDSHLYPTCEVLFTAALLGDLVPPGVVNRALKWLMRRRVGPCWTDDWQLPSEYLTALAYRAATAHGVEFDARASRQWLLERSREVVDRREWRMMIPIEGGLLQEPISEFPRAAIFDVLSQDRHSYNEAGFTELARSLLGARDALGVWRHPPGGHEAPAFLNYHVASGIAGLLRNKGALHRSRTAARSAAPLGDAPWQRLLPEEARVLREESLNISSFRVVGSYARCDDVVRRRLTDVTTQMLDAVKRTDKSLANYLFWGHPGRGKSYLIEQAGAFALRIGVASAFEKIVLPELDEAGLSRRLAETGGAHTRSIVLIDECDGKLHEKWPFPLLLPYLEARQKGGGSRVVALVGSCGESMSAMTSRITERAKDAKGPDLLDRIPEENWHEIPDPDAGDRVVIFLSQMLAVAAEEGRRVTEVEKLALLYVMRHAGLQSVRRLTQCATDAVRRAGSSPIVCYDHLFEPGDDTNKSFYNTHIALIRTLGRPCMRVAAE